MNGPAPVIERVRASSDNIEVLAQLRMTVFAEWPYLYAGDLAYEQRYLQDFLIDERAVLVVARIGDQPVGMATASPLDGQPDGLTEPLAGSGFDLSRSFYFGESVLLPAYRGLGIGHRFFDERERAAREYGADRVLFCAVMRESDHPLRPMDARDLKPFWRRRGYAPLPGVAGRIDWAELGEIGETAHAMQFWQKHL